MALDFSFGPIDNNTWAKFQSAVLRRDDAEHYPAILLYPHDSITTDDVEREVETLSKVLGRCPFTLVRDVAIHKSSETAFLQKEISNASVGTPPLYPGGKYCDIPGHCFPTPQGLAAHVKATGHMVASDLKYDNPYDEDTFGVKQEKLSFNYGIDQDAMQKPDVKSFLEYPNGYSFYDWKDSTPEAGRDEVLKLLAMGDQDWHDRFMQQLQLSEDPNSGVDLYDVLVMFNSRRAQFDEKYNEHKNSATVEELKQLHATVDWDENSKRLEGIAARIPDINENFKSVFAEKLSEGYMKLYDEETYDPFALVSENPVDDTFESMKNALTGWASASTDDRAHALWLWASHKYDNIHIPAKYVREHKENFTQESAYEFDASALIAQTAIRSFDPTYDPETDTVYLYRGVDNDLADNIRKALKDPAMERITITHRCLESWSANPEIATRFGNIVIKTRIPVTSVVAVGYRSDKLLNGQQEMEYVVATPGGDAYYTRDDFYDMRGVGESIWAMDNGNKKFRESAQPLWREHIKKWLGPKIQEIQERKEAQLKEKNEKIRAAYNAPYHTAVHEGQEKLLVHAIRDQFKKDIQALSHYGDSSKAETKLNKDVYAATEKFIETAVEMKEMKGKIDERDMRDIYIKALQTTDAFEYSSETEVKRKSAQTYPGFLNMLRDAGLQVDEIPPPPPFPTIEQLPEKMRFTETGYRDWENEVYNAVKDVIKEYNLEVNNGASYSCCRAVRNLNFEYGEEIPTKALIDRLAYALRINMGYAPDEKTLEGAATALVKHINDSRENKIVEMHQQMFDILENPFKGEYGVYKPDLNWGDEAWKLPIGTGTDWAQASLAATNKITEFVDPSGQIVDKSFSTYLIERLNDAIKDRVSYGDPSQLTDFDLKSMINYAVKTFVPEQYPDTRTKLYESCYRTIKTIIKTMEES